MRLTLELDLPKPASRRATPKPAPCVPGGPGITLRGPARKRMRVLLIEDDAKPALTIETSLEQQGYRVDIAAIADLPGPTRVPLTFATVS